MSDLRNASLVLKTGDLANTVGTSFQGILTSTSNIYITSGSVTTSSVITGITIPSLSTVSGNNITLTKTQGASQTDTTTQNAVISSVRNLLLTNFYERPFQPEIGSNLDGLLFQPATNLTAHMLESEIKNVINNYEPRVTIDVLEVTLSADNNSFSVYFSFFVGNNTVPTTVNLILQRSR